MVAGRAIADFRTHYPSLRNSAIPRCTAHRIRSAVCHRSRRHLRRYLYVLTVRSLTPMALADSLTLAPWTRRTRVRFSEGVSRLEVNGHTGILARGLHLAIPAGRPLPHCL